VNRYEILLNKLPQSDPSITKDSYGRILKIETERILVLGKEHSGKTKILFDDAIKVLSESSQYIKFISHQKTEIANEHGLAMASQSVFAETDLKSNFFQDSWSEFQCKGMRFSGKALYLDDILFYKDIDGSLLNPKEVLTWASSFNTVSRIVASCYLSEFSGSFGYENKVIPSTLVIDQASWIVKVLG